ncbi:MAG: metallophosphoesterase [Candidatus Hydrogenedentota bacterium]
MENTKDRVVISFLAVVATTWAAAAAALDMVVHPYMNYPTQESIVVRWETDTAASSEVHWGRKLPLEKTTTTDGMHTYHEVTLTGLNSGTPYFYQVASRDAGGAEVESEVYTFSTAPERDDAFGFAVLCDTQSNPKAVRTLAEHAYAQRPAFTLLGGDLVSEGTNKFHWTRHFFPNMAPLNSRVPLVPTLGNHERDADYFYEYFTLPEPEYYYQFNYGNLAVFLVDSQKPFTRSGEIYPWLDKALAESDATWKIVMHHKPPYSSDEDDYGNTYEGPSVMGDFNARMLVPLYEKHGVDIVWSGHIHTYERTWPLKNNKAVSADEGILYMITGGGGGGLENAAPVRTPLSAKVYRGHHYCYVMVNGNTLRIEAYDLDDRLFDWVELEKNTN